MCGRPIIAALLIIPARPTPVSRLCFVSIILLLFRHFLAGIWEIFSSQDRHITSSCMSQPCVDGIILRFPLHSSLGHCNLSTIACSCDSVMKYLLSPKCSGSGNLQISSRSCGGGIGVCNCGGGCGSPDGPACGFIATCAGGCGSPDGSTGAVVDVDEE